MSTGKTIALTIWVFVSKVMCLLFNMPSRFAISFSSGPHFVRTLHHDLSVSVALYSMAYSFTELDKAVVHVIRLVSFHSVCPLMEEDKRLMEAS